MNRLCTEKSRNVKLKKNMIKNKRMEPNTSHIAFGYRRSWVKVSRQTLKTPIIQEGCPKPCNERYASTHMYLVLTACLTIKRCKCNAYVLLLFRTNDDNSHNQNLKHKPRCLMIFKCGSEKIKCWKT